MLLGAVLNYMDDILTNLVDQMELTLRRALAEKLADTPSAPSSLITFLAQDEASVARPILLKSCLLRDEQLIEIVKHRTKEHQLCIAMRRNISELVSSSLIEKVEHIVRKDSARSRCALTCQIDQGLHIPIHSFLHRRTVPPMRLCALESLTSPNLL